MDTLSSDFVWKTRKATTSNGHPVVVLPTVTGFSSLSVNKHRPPEKCRRRRQRAQHHSGRPCKHPLDVSRQKVFFMKPAGGGYVRCKIGKQIDVAPAADGNDQEPKKGRPKGSKNKNKYEPLGHGFTDKSFVYTVDAECVACDLSPGSDLLAHALERHKDNCPTCGGWFGEQLTEHFGTHATTKQTYLTVTCHVCFSCGEKYGNSDLLRAHVLDVHVRKSTQLKCCICGHSPAQNTVMALRQHVSVMHSDSDPATMPDTCGYCDQRPGRNTLVTHLFDKHLSKATVSLACLLCEKQCENLEAMVDHLVGEHCTVKTFRRPAVYRCQSCHIGFKTQTSVLRHPCGLIKNLYCEKCDKMFPSKMRLAFHLQFHDHPVYPTMHLHCDVCLVEMEDECHLYDHIRFQHEVCEKSVCETCGRTFKTSMGLSIHRRYHVGDRHYTCKTCGKSFLNRSTLKEHEISHMDVKPFRCHICNQYLSRASRLRSHVKSHKAAESTVQRCYYCTVCCFVAPNFNMITSHVGREHNFNGQVTTVDLSMVVKCEYCDSTYVDSSWLNKHRDTTHPQDGNPEAFVCALCSSTFITYSRLATHKLTHGINTESTLFECQIDNGNNVDQDRFCIPQFFSCEHCSKTCLHYTYLCLHRKLKHTVNTGKVKCNRCPQEFKSSWKLVYHKKTVHGFSLNQEDHTDDVHQCNLCSRKFNKVGALNLHKTRSHIDNGATTSNGGGGGGKYLCDHCGKSQTTERSLNSHKKTHCNRLRVVADSQQTYQKIPAATATSSMEIETPAATLTSDRFACTFCQLVFDERTAFVEHITGHTAGQAAVLSVDHTVCNLCNKDLLDVAFLKCHLEQHALINQTLTCHVCCTAFLSVDGFGLHVRTAHHMTAEEPADPVADDLYVPEIKFVGLPEDPMEYNPLVIDCSNMFDPYQTEPLAVNSVDFIKQEPVFDELLELMPQSSLEPQQADQRFPETDDELYNLLVDLTS
ncbi:zinc finger protein 91-like [Adelges cooleyi]|uniref:zinc finger protein 91-like n=1 Tax=Adelges cooleyi TaxID=133065 RepID=UPI00217F3A71|nr:zinc finger protein 91-like [Adelges cooleyi]